MTKKLTQEERSNFVNNVLLKKADEVYDNIRKHLFETQTKEKATSVYRFLHEESYIAGGFFRSIIADTDINDVDIFFKSFKAAIKFREMMNTPNPPLYITSRSQNLSYTACVSDDEAYPRVSFITYKGCEPIRMVTSFDFSFNQHYYSPSDGEFYFDNGSFDKIGHLVLGEIQDTSHAGTLLRYIRFLKEGWDISYEGLPMLLNRYKNETMDNANFNRTFTVEQTMEDIIIGCTGESHYDETYHDNGVDYYQGGLTPSEGINRTDMVGSLDFAVVGDQEIPIRPAYGLAPDWQERMRETAQELTESARQRRREFGPIGGPQSPPPTHAQAQMEARQRFWLQQQQASQQRHGFSRPLGSLSSGLGGGTLTDSNSQSSGTYTYEVVHEWIPQTNSVEARRAPIGQQDEDLDIDLNF